MTHSLNQILGSNPFLEALQGCTFLTGIPNSGYQAKPAKLNRLKLLNVMGKHSGAQTLFEAC